NKSTTFFQGDISGFQGTFAHESIDSTTTTSFANGMTFNGTTAASFDGSQAKFVLSGLTSGTTLPFRFGSATADLVMKMGNLSGTGGIIEQVASTNTTLEIGHLNQNGTYGGVINGAMNWSKVGTGTFNIDGPSDYNGTATVVAGRLN